jgi:RNA polymerase sigma-70 factor (ECF subfamily)
VTTIQHTPETASWAAYEEYAPAIRAYAARRVEPDAVDDIVAETFAIACRRMPDDGDPLPWLYGVARKVVHGHRRSHARRSALVERVASHEDPNGAAPDPADAVPDVDAELVRAFATLSEKEREAIRLVALEGLSGKDAARAAGCSPATFAVRLSRARKRLRVALLAAVAAVAITLGFALAPSGERGGPVTSQVVVERAVAATAPEGGSILEVRSTVDVRSSGTLHQEKTTWVQVDERGKPGIVRSYISKARGETVKAPLDEVSRTGDPSGYQVPSIVFRAHELLSKAERADGKARLGGTETFEGRKVHRLVVTGVEEEPLPGDRDVLLIDAETYQPVALRKHSEGNDVYGKPFTYDFIERVVDQRKLPDTEENRRLLKLGGPTR